MPPMPKGKPWASIQKLVEAERAIRSGRSVSLATLHLDRYWSDLVQLLQIYWHFKRRESDKIMQIKKKISVRVYDPYIDDKRQSAEKTKSKAAA